MTLHVLLILVDGFGRMGKEVVLTRPSTLFRVSAQYERPSIAGESDGSMENVRQSPLPPPLRLFVQFRSARPNMTARVDISPTTVEQPVSGLHGDDHTAGRCATPTRVLFCPSPGGRDVESQVRVATDPRGTWPKGWGWRVYREISPS